MKREHDILACACVRTSERARNLRTLYLDVIGRAQRKQFEGDVQPQRPHIGRDRPRSLRISTMIIAYAIPSREIINACASRAKMKGNEKPRGKAAKGAKERKREDNTERYTRCL